MKFQEYSVVWRQDPFQHAVVEDARGRRVRRVDPGDRLEADELADMLNDAYRKGLADGHRESLMEHD